MKTIIIYTSTHHGNTEKVGKAIGEVLNADLHSLEKENASSISLEGYDLIGLGFTIHAWNAPRLVYADWLLEHGDARGEIIQLQCRRAQLADDDEHARELDQKLRPMLDASWSSMAGDLAPWASARRRRPRGSWARSAPVSSGASATR